MKREVRESLGGEKMKRGEVGMIGRSIDR